ncbi:MAG: hypothetical protein KDA96_23945, partial [Planctomycetaceae bacterium]|nr:hypothetical protein [Planctomycetaceae bacterium]
EQGQLGGVFEGFGEDTMALNALARFLHYHYSSMTQQQRAVAELFRSGCSVTEISQQLDIAATNVSRQKKAIAWPMLHEGESALQALLERFNCENDWA